MLPGFIIEEIRKRELEKQRREERPVIQLPLPIPTYGDDGIPPKPEEKEERGITIIQFF